MGKMPPDKLLFILKGQITTPPFSHAAGIDAGYLLRKLQQGESIGMPRSRPMPVIGRRCHELRIVDTDQTWRIIYRIDSDAIVVAEIFCKKRRETPKSVVDVSKARLKSYDDAAKDDGHG